MRMRLAWLALAALLFVGPRAQAHTVGPGQSLLVPFTLSGAGLSAADTLAFLLTNVNAGDATGLTVELYDGATLATATLIGSNVGVSVSEVAAFVHSGSVFAGGNIVPADLSSVRNGTIAGLIRVVPSFSGSDPLTADVSPFTSLIVGIATSPSQIDPTGISVALGTVSVVPEPSVAVLFGVSSALLVGCSATCARAERTGTRRER